MPADRRRKVTIRSSIPDSIGGTADFSRVIRTSIQTGRPRVSQRFEKETPSPSDTDLLNETRGVAPSRQAPDVNDNIVDFDTVQSFISSPSHSDAEDAPERADGDSGLGLEDDDILPSFGPQLSLFESQDHSLGADDIVEFAQVNLDYYNKQVRVHSSRSRQTS